MRMKQPPHRPNESTSIDVLEFLAESNSIEGVHTKEALDDAVEAWEYTVKQKKIGLKEILCIHKILMKRQAPAIAGKWRDCDVRIGGQRKWFVSEGLIKEEVQMVINYIEKTVPLYIGEERAAKVAHVMFEDVHPFADGNGRTGRILMNWHRLQLELPILIIHADWPDEDGEQKSYYQWFK